MRKAFGKQPIPAESLRGDFAVSGAGLDLLSGLPPLTGLEGTGYITGHVFEVHAKAGQMELGAGRKLNASDVYFKVPNTDPAPIVPAEAGARITGGAEAVADLLNHDAVKTFAGFSIDPAKVKGQAQGQLTLALGLGKQAKPEDQKFRVEGALSNLSIDGYIGNEKFEQGALDIFADGGTVRLTGQGQFDTIPAKVEVLKTPTDEGQVGLTLALDNATRARLAINPGVALNGPMTVKLKSQFNRQGADAEVDLGKLEITGVDGLQLKPAGKPGKATFSLKSSPDGTAISNIVVDAGTLAARGQAQFGADGVMQEVKLSALRFAANDELRLDLLGGTPLKASLRGSTLDARGLIKAFLSRDPQTQGVRDLELDAKIGAAQGANNQSISQLDMTMARRDGVMTGLNIAGKLGQGTLSVSKSGSGPLEMRATDAGAAARFLDFYSRIDGGSLTLTLVDQGEGSHGVATIKGFTLENESALRRMESAAPAAAPVATANHQAGAGASADSVRFDRLNATFLRTSGRFDIEDLLVYNTSEGITGKGYVDFAHDKVEIAGTFLPLYPVNSLVTNIPVLGILLTGGPHEGIFGVNFRVTGPASAPTLTVNPLSGVTPGIFRKIFGVIDGTQWPTSPEPTPPK